MMNPRRYWILMLAVVIAAGCQHKAPIESNRTAVQGTVTLDGKPLPAGGITFISTKDPMYRVTAMIRSDGTFRVADAPKGPVGVSVDTELIRAGNPAAYVPIPARYGDVKTSGLTATVTKGDATPLSFELKSK